MNKTEVAVTEGLVSIITPLYNNERYIEGTIRSVLDQTYEQWEMIIVDDASTDGGAAVVRNYTDKASPCYDSRIRYYRNAVNSGVAATRNQAIELAGGRYIAFLDSDDLWQPEKLAKQLALMRETHTGFCYGGCGVIDENGSNLHRDRSVPARIDYRELLKGNQIPCLTVLLDRTVVEHIRMPSIPHEDYATWLDILRTHAITACGVQEVLADYRVGKPSVSSGKGKAARWTWDIYRKYLGLPFWECVYCFCWYAIRALGKHA
jgi:glycosyltransferase involved in cell wall biosynthesis